MENSKEIQEALARIESKLETGFNMVNKRLDGIEHELRKIDTVLHYSEKYKNILP